MMIQLLVEFKQGFMEQYLRVDVDAKLSGDEQVRVAMDEVKEKYPPNAMNMYEPVEFIEITLPQGEIIWSKY